ncbi:MAG: hypothetical protein JST32_18065 [Bacteroidetes bacterium]|nr:hypothetical protein [Bacteroidota bacterium]
MEKNLLIDILLYGEQQLMKPHDFLLNEIEQALIALGHRPDIVSFATQSYLSVNFAITEENKYRINSDGLARIMTYHSLVMSEAGVKKAEQSIRVAKWSLWIATAVSLISLGVSLYTVSHTGPVSLNRDQEQKITNNSFAILQELQKIDHRDSMLQLLSIPKSNFLLKKPLNMPRASIKSKN